MGKKVENEIEKTPSWEFFPAGSEIPIKSPFDNSCPKDIRISYLTIFLSFAVREFTIHFSPVFQLGCCSSKKKNQMENPCELNFHNFFTSHL